VNSFEQPQQQQQQLQQPQQQQPQQQQPQQQQQQYQYPPPPPPYQPQPTQQQQALMDASGFTLSGLFINMLELEGDAEQPLSEAQAVLGEVEAELSTISADTILRIGVDSGAAVSVMPPTLCEDYPVCATPESASGTTYRTADGSHIPDQGMRTIMGTPSGSSVVQGVRLRVAPVHKPLLSVAEMVDAGYTVVFRKKDGQDVSCAVNSTTQQQIKFSRRNKIYEIDMAVQPYHEVQSSMTGSSSSGLQRQA
jgi:hypothetical protein